MTAPILSEKTKDILSAIMTNPGKTAPELAKIQGVSVQTVTGALSSLKKNDLVTVTDSKITATATAELTYNEDGSPIESKAPTGITTHLASSAPAATAAEAKGDEADGSESETDSTVIEGTATPTPSAMASIAAGTPTAPVVEKASVPNKSDKAREIWAANPGAERSVLMALLMAPDVGLTHNGANTYIYNMRKKAGMVKARATAAPVEAAETIAATEISTAAILAGADVVIDASTAAEEAAAPEVSAETAVESIAEVAASAEAEVAA